MPGDAQVSSVDPSKPPRGRSGGFIIVAVLWILAALATLSLIYSIYARQATLDFVIHDERLQAQALTMSGVELAVYQLTKKPGARPLEGRFSFNQGYATIDVRFVSENSRVDLNFAPKQLLAGLLSSLAVPYQEALYEADRIIGWRSPLESGPNDPETAFYQAVGKAYGPRHGPFQSPEELAMVADLRPGLAKQILPYVTVYSGQPEINALVASPPVLSAVPGVTPQLLQLLIKAQQSNTQDQLGVVMQNVTLDAARADRVTVTVRFRSGRIIRTQAVILLSNAGSEPYRVLSWRDDELSVERSASRMQ